MNNSIVYKLINLGLLLSFLICYLEWGQDMSGFLFQMEYDLFADASNSISSFLHPLILLPFIGQVVLLVSMFLRKPHRKLTLVVIAFLGVLVFMVLLVGVLSLNFKIIISAFPFVLISAYYVFSFQKRIKT
jgi:heme A synthase